MLVTQVYNYEGSVMEIDSVSNDLMNLNPIFVVRINIPSEYQSEITGPLKVNVNGILIDFTLKQTNNYLAPNSFKYITYFLVGCYDTNLNAVFIGTTWNPSWKKMKIVSPDSSKEYFRITFIRGYSGKLFCSTEMIDSRIGLSRVDKNFVTRGELVATGNVDKAYLQRYTDNNLPIGAHIIYKTPTKEIYGVVCVNILNQGASGLNVFSLVFAVNDNMNPLSLITTKKTNATPAITKNIIEISQHQNGNFFFQSRYSPSTMYYGELFASSPKYTTSIGNSWYWLQDNYKFTNKATGVAYGERYGKSLDSDGNVSNFDSGYFFNWFTGCVVRDLWGDQTDELVYNGSNMFSKQHNQELTYLMRPQSFILWGDEGCILLMEPGTITLYFDVTNYIKMSYPQLGSSPQTTQKNVSKTGEIIVCYYDGSSILKIQFLVIDPVFMELTQSRLINLDMSASIIGIGQVEPNAYGQTNTKQTADFWMFVVNTSLGKFIVTINDNYEISRQIIWSDNTTKDIKSFFFRLDQLSDADKTWLLNNGVL